MAHHGCHRQHVPDRRPSCSCARLSVSVAAEEVGKAGKAGLGITASHCLVPKCFGREVAYNPAPQIY